MSAHPHERTNRDSERIPQRAQALYEAFERAFIVDEHGEILARKGLSLADSIWSDPSLRSQAVGIVRCMEGAVHDDPDSLMETPEGTFRLRGFPVSQETGEFRGCVVAATLVVPEQRHLPGMDGREIDFLVRNIQQGIWRLDPQGKILEANPYLAQWLETTPDRMVGRHSSEFLATQSPSPDPQQTGASDRFEAEFRTETGMERHAIVVSTRLQQAGVAHAHTIQLMTDISAERFAHQRLAKQVRKMATLAGTDSLTALANRRTFETELAAALRLSDSEAFAVILCDLDGLKAINDRLGHAAGDTALKKVAERLKSMLRSQDLVSRLGGDEFAVLVRDIDPVELRDFADRLSNAMQFSANVNGEWMWLTTSAGWAHSFDQGDILELADRDLYAKKQGRMRSTGPTLL